MDSASPAVIHAGTRMNVDTASELLYRKVAEAGIHEEEIILDTGVTSRDTSHNMMSLLQSRFIAREQAVEESLPQVRWFGIEKFEPKPFILSGYLYQPDTKFYC